jgi:hypothetical protein
VSRSFLQSRRSWRLYVFLVAAGLVIAVAAGLAAETALTRRHPENYVIPPVPSLPGATSPAASPGSAAPSASGPLQVLPGTAAGPGGVRTGYPDTLAGAVSAAVQDWSQIGSCLNPARAALVGTAIADPSWRRAGAALAAGVQSTRKGLGLPASGPLPAGASVTFTAVDYQVRDATAGRVTVLLLAYYAVTLPGQQPATSTGVYPAAMHWARGDWKILAPGGPSYAGLDAQPGSAQAAADGWLPLDQ